MNDIARFIVEAGLPFLAGVAVAAGIVYVVAFLPEKSARYRKFRFIMACKVVVDAEKTGKMAGPFPKGLYYEAKKTIAEYIEQEGILQAQITGTDEAPVIVNAIKEKKALRPAKIRVRELLQKMEYTDEQIDSIFRKAENTIGQKVMENYDELLWFALKEVQNV